MVAVADIHEPMSCVMLVQVEWQAVSQLKGADRCRKLVRMKLGQLQMAIFKKQQKMFLEILPECLNNVLPKVTLDDTAETCMAKIREHPNFEENFVDISKWEEDQDFLMKFSKEVSHHLGKWVGQEKLMW